MEDINEGEMEYFQLIRPKSPVKPSTYANQLTVQGYSPKTGTSPMKQLKCISSSYTSVSRLNARLTWDNELHKWMAYRDLIKHPNKKIRDQWCQAGINEFARLTQRHKDTERLNVVTFIPKGEMPEGKQATYARYMVDYRPEKDEPW